MRWLLVTAVLVCGASLAHAQTPTVVDVYTMGPSEQVFQRFGHAAICVHDDKTPEGRCFNYGTTNFDDPGNVIWTFVRGKSKFWVSVTSLRALLDFYIDLDRTLYKQRLPLTPGQARELAARLDGDLAPDKKYYIYHHFYDNCTTRIRDHVDAVVAGKLKGDTDKVKYGPTYRELAMTGFSSSVPLLVGNEILLGSSADVQPTIWAAMFLPDVMREWIEKNLGAPVEIVNVRQAPLPAGNPGGGRLALFAFAGIMAVVAAAGVLSRRRWLKRLSLVFIGFVSGLLALILFALAILSVLPELRKNELLFVLLPLDFAIMFIGGRKLRLYLTARLAQLVLVSFAAAVGLLVQPLWSIIAMLALPFGIIAGVEWRAVRRARETAAPPEERVLLRTTGGDRG